MWNHQVSKSRAHSENFEPAVGIPPITCRITDVETIKGTSILGICKQGKKCKAK